MKTPKNGLLFLFATTFLLLMTGCSSAGSSVTLVSSTPAPTPTPSPSPAPPVVTVVSKKVAVGTSKASVINTSGVGLSWGSNYESINGTGGQLGIGLNTNVTRTTPQTLDDVGTTYLSIVSGETQACGITNSQIVKCWGAYVGDGSGAEKYSPTPINDGGASTYLDISSGSYHVCAINSAGVMSCWGDGWEGKLGNGDGGGATQNSPVVADTGTTYKRVAAGRNHTCGITSANAVKCWGDNTAGQLGDTTTTSPRLSAVTADPGVSYSEIFAGEDTTCGITTAGVLKCWGANNNGQLGDGTTTPRSSPTVVDIGTTYSKVALGITFHLHTCAITTAGVLKCWGSNTSGQLGNGSTTQSLSPVVIDTGISYREVSAGYEATCGITVGGSLNCWGNNSLGQLGIGNTTQQTSPALVGSGY